MTDREPERNGLLRPGIPIIDVQIRSADPGGEYADLDVIDACCRFGNLFQPQASSTLPLHQSLQRDPLSLRLPIVPVSSDLFYAFRWSTLDMALGDLRPPSILTDGGRHLGRSAAIAENLPGITSWWIGVGMLRCKRSQC